MCPVLLALSFVWGTEDKLITSTNRPILLCSAATVVAVCVEVTRLLLFTACFFLAFACLFFFCLGCPSRFCGLVRASHPLVVLPCQPAHVCPVLSEPSFVCRTEGMFKLYSFAKTTRMLLCSAATVAVYVGVTRLL